MYQRKFIDRKDELNFLQSRYTTGSPEFIVIYGRRRVGKTELILKFMENKKGIYYLASKEGDRSNIKDFSYRISRMIGDDNFKKRYISIRRDRISFECGIQGTKEL